MIEDVTITDLSRESTSLDENSLKYTCKECNVKTTSKKRIDDHVKSQHSPDEEEEVKFVCNIS